MARVLASLGARVQLTARLPRTRRPNVARDAGSAKETATSEVLPAPGAQPADSGALELAASGTVGWEKSTAPRSADSSGAGVKMRRFSAAWYVVTRGSVCVDAGGTSAHPQ